jgi:antitoxin component of MazEF toxin-antitoxin module
MIKTISKIGNSQGLIFDSALLKLANLKVGDKINIEIHSGGTITLTPMEEPEIDAEIAGAAAKRLIGKNNELFRRLS